MTNPSPVLAFVKHHLQANPKATFAEVRALAATEGLQLYPIVYGRAKAVLGLLPPKTATTDSSNGPSPPQVEPMPGSVPDPTPEPSSCLPDAPPQPDAWTQEFARLRVRFPEATDGVLYCIFRLQQNPELRLHDLKDDARLHGVLINRRSIHLARVALDLHRSKTRQGSPRQAVSNADEKRNPAPLATSTRSPIEHVEQLIRALQDQLDAKDQELERLRAALQDIARVIEEGLL